mgnify:CR=1 FL=1
MSVSFVDSEHSSNNPLELLVEIVGANDWPHERTGLNELACLLYTSPSPRDRTRSRMPSSA